MSFSFKEALKNLSSNRSPESLTNDLKTLKENAYYAQKMMKFGIWTYEPEKDEFTLSDEVYSIYGSKFEKSFDGFKLYLHPEDKDEVIKRIDELLNGKLYDIEFRIITQIGTIKFIREKVSISYNEKNEIQKIFGVTQDITNQKIIAGDSHSIDSTSYSSKRIEGIGNWTYDVSKDSYYLSEELYVIHDVEPHEFKSDYQILLKAVHKDDQEKLKHLLERARNGKKSKVDYRIITKDSSIKHLQVKSNVAFDLYGETTFIYGTVNDITKRKKLEEQMVYDANHDQLTGLKNRNYFLEGLNEIEKEAKSANLNYAFMILTIDDLKYINLSLGYDLGDKLILAVLDRLKMLLSDESSIIRYSGDDFAILAKDEENEESYEKLAERMIEEISKPYSIDSYEVTITINIGACVFPKAKSDDLSLREAVKIALLRSKKLGKNSYKFYSSELNIQYYKDFTLKNDLKDAIKNEQLEIYYQPLVHLKDHEIMGAEALIRWNHPEWGVVPPDEFISIAEETGFIVEIGKWVLKEVFKAHKKWIDKKLPAIEISVNFSAIQFFEKDFTESIKNIIKRFDFNPEFLVMEITENILLENRQKVNTDIQELRSLGIKVAIDDFGTGYSSLSYLNSLAIDRIKIDRSFIMNIPTDSVGASITKSTVELGKELNIEVLAEGIENSNQLAYLQKINTTLGQGYIYSKPVKLKEFERILARKRCQPILPNPYALDVEKERRKFFRVDFIDFLEADMTILKIGGRDIDIGNTKVLVKNIGPGGLSFISTIRFPIEKDITLKFNTSLVEEEIIAYGNPVWIEEIDSLNKDNEQKIYQYGIEFMISENDRIALIKILNEVQIKMRNDIMFSEGRFIASSYSYYFNS